MCLYFFLFFSENPLYETIMVSGGNVDSLQNYILQCMHSRREGGVSNQLLKTINFRVQERLEKYCKGKGGEE